MQEEYSNQIGDCPQFAPYVTLNPTSGKHGQANPVQATIGGLSWGGTVKITMGTAKVKGKFILDGYGNAWAKPLTFKQPTKLGPGTYTVTITDVKTGTKATAQYQIT
ncbi:MAG TPA: hypothetical protein VKX16_08790, partial [Chloroflexota bacterium]|nr:hypothetical protein [Chloroflexota bacterium]